MKKWCMAFVLPGLCLFLTGCEPPASEESNEPTPPGMVDTHVVEEVEAETLGTLPGLTETTEEDRKETEPGGGQ